MLIATKICIGMVLNRLVKNMQIPPASNLEVKLRRLAHVKLDIIPVLSETISNCICIILKASKF